jgi:hypothetical protein
MRVALFLALAASVPAYACPGAKSADAAGNSSQKAEYVGSACSMATGSMAQRVLLDGAEFAWSGVLAPARKKVIDQVAVPFLAGEDLAVVANAILDAVDPKVALDLRGKVLDVDGVRYVVLTEARPRTS